MKKSNTECKQILIDMNNYNTLKQLDHTGDSFNEGIRKLINNQKERKKCL